MRSDEAAEGMVLVMGITGSGKSYFVNKLKEGATVIGDTMDSCEPITLCPTHLFF
jgi:predicted GTPase